MSLDTLHHQIKEVILKYEKEELNFDEAQKIISEITHKELDKHTLDNYWRSEDLDEFVTFLSTDEIPNWKELDDNSSLKLITEILENTEVDAILERNGNALEKRFRKTTGTVMDLIFQEDMSDPDEILNRLKRDTSIKL